MRVNVLIIFGSEIKKRNFFDWLLSHVSGASPPHRYIGLLELKGSGIQFNGIDTVDNSETEILFRFENITEVFHGYDNLYSVFQTRGLGLTWAPVRLTLDNGEDLAYIIVGYDSPGTYNADFYAYLKEQLE